MVGSSAVDVVASPEGGPAPESASFPQSQAVMTAARKNARRIALNFGSQLTVLRLPRPADKCLPSSPQSPAEELCERSGSKPVDGDRHEEREHGLALTDVDVFRLLDEADMPTKRSTVEPFEVAVSEEQR